MELESSIAELSKKITEHSEVLLTEEAAKNALVMPFLAALGYNPFDPTEVVPEFVCDVGTKKGEKVDYAIMQDGAVSILVECKPVSAELNINHASQLFRYFTTTDARIAILTNGVAYQFYSDTDAANRMDDKPFFTLQLDTIKKSDLRTLQRFTKQSFDIEKIVEEAGKLKMQSQVYKALQQEFDDPSEEFVKLVAGQVYPGRLTSSVKDTFKSLIVNSVNSLIRDRVTDRLTSALSASSPSDDESDQGGDDTETTDAEIEGYNIVRAIGSKLVDPKRIVMRDAKSYCAILLDNNNRKTIARLHFNSDTVRYVGTFIGKEETRVQLQAPVDLFKHNRAISRRIKELEEQ